MKKFFNDITTRDVYKFILVLFVSLGSLYGIAIAPALLPNDPGIMLFIILVMIWFAFLTFDIEYFDE